MSNFACEPLYFTIYTTLMLMCVYGLVWYRFVDKWMRLFLLMLNTRFYEFLVLFVLPLNCVLRRIVCVFPIVLSYLCVCACVPKCIVFVYA